MHGLLSDLRYTLRSLGRSRGFTAASTLCLGLGIGSATVIYGIVNTVFLEPLPFEDPDSIVVLRATNPERGVRSAAPSLADFVDWRAEARSFEQLAAFEWRQVDLIEEGKAVRLPGLSVTEDYFDLLGVQPSLGRAFTPEELERDEPVLVVAKDVWERHLSADTALVGRTVWLHSWYRSPEPGSTPFTLTGIVADEVRFLPTTAWFRSRGAGIDDRVAFWMPLSLPPSMARERGSRLGGVEVVGRLKRGVRPNEARAEMDVIARQLQQRYPDTNAGWGVDVIPLRRHVLGDVRRALEALVAAVGFLLLIAGTNVAGMMLLRAAAHERELAVRAALGASAGTLIRQRWIEVMLVVVGGAALGLVVARSGVLLFIGLAPPEIPRVERLSFDAAVFGFALAAALVTAVVVGLVPLRRAASMGVDPSRSLGATGARASRQPSVFPDVLVTGAVALTLVLVVSATVLVQSFIELRRVDPGFDAENLLTAKISLPAAAYEWQHNSTFVNEVMDRVDGLPGVIAVGAVMGLPMSGQQIPSTITVEGRDTPKHELPSARIRVVSEGYFRAMGIALVAGRQFVPLDSVGTIGWVEGAIINESMARRLWPGVDPVGKRFRTVPDADGWIEVIGVVGDVHYGGLAGEVGLDVYFPERLFPQAEISLVVRTATPAILAAAALRDEIRAVEPAAFVTDIATMDELVELSVAKERLSAWVVAAFSSVALCLAAFGLYGLASLVVHQRRGELGVRVALGAPSSSVALLVMKRGLTSAAGGVALGAAASFAVTRILATIVVPVAPVDGSALLVSTLVLMGVVLTASYLPAHRLVRANPVRVLRHE